MKKREWHKIVKKAMAGNTEAFETIYRTKATIILAHATKLVYNPSAVDDTVQEIAIRMYTNINNLRSPEAFNVWLYRIILNTCHTANTQAAAHSHAALDDMTEEPEETSMKLQPVSAAELADRNSIITQAIDKLPESQRLALTMFYYDEMTYKEIAQALNLTTSGVGVTISRAKQTLKRLVAPGEGSEDADNILYGAALVPVIQQALHTEMDKLAASGHTEAIIRHGLEGVHTLQATAPAAHPALGTVLVKGVRHLAVLAGSVALAATVMTIVLPTWRESMNPVAAEIVMEDGGAYEHINPGSIRIDVPDSTVRVIEWRIEDVNDTSLYTGTTQTIDTKLYALPPGEYEAVWLVETTDNHRTWVRRAFTIT